VVAAIAPRLEQAEIDRAERKPTENLDAVDLYYRAIQSFRRVNREENENALRLARQAISLNPKFAAAYGVALACFSQRFDESWMEHVDEEITEAKQYALRAVELGADDAFALSRAAHFFGQQLKDAETADTIVDQAIIVNPNLSEAWRIRGFISIYLGRHEAAAQQFQHAMRLNPLDPEIYKAETGLAMANFLLRQFEIALSWATKSLAHQKKYAIPVLFAAASSAMLGRIADAKALLAHLNASGNPLTISRFKKRTPLKRQEDVDLFTEAYRLAGMSE
jgi:tetratricopeptide (TPR) repeat protein